MNSLNLTQNLSISHSRTISSTVPCFVTDSTATRISRLLVYGIVMAVSLVANILIVAIVCGKEKRMKKPINFFIVNIACCDLILTTVYMPRVVNIFSKGYEWLIDDIMGTVTCKFVAYAHETAITVIVLTVVVISVERFFSLVFPFKTNLQNPPFGIIIASLWFVAAAFRFPIVYAIQLKTFRLRTYCILNLDEAFEAGTEKLYYQTVVVVLYACPLVAILVFYTAIVITLMKQKHPGGGGCARRRMATRKELRNRRVVRMILIVVAVFIICWIFYFIQFVLYTYDIPIPCEAMFARLFLAHSNCAITPCLYFIFSENYRNGLKKIWLNAKRIFTSRNKNGREQDQAGEMIFAGSSDLPTEINQTSNSNINLKKGNNFHLVVRTKGGNSMVMPLVF